MKICSIIAASGVAAAALTLGVGTASASTSIPLTLAPGTNTLTFTLQNNTDYNQHCMADAISGSNEVDPSFDVAPHSPQTVTYINVPAGNYRVSWECGSFGLGSQLTTVPGVPNPTGTPIRSDNPAPGATGSPSTSMFSLGELQSLLSQIPTGSAQTLLGQLPTGS